MLRSPTDDLFGTDTGLSLPLPTPAEAVSTVNTPTEADRPPASAADVVSAAETSFDGAMSVEAAEFDRTTPEKPFVIELLRLERQPNGSFQPESAVQITRTLATSGFLHQVSAEDVKTLLGMLTCTTANGDCIPTLSQVAQSLQVSEMQTRQRLERLTSARWNALPLVYVMPNQEGLDRYILSPHLVTFVERPPLVSDEPTGLLPRPAGRDALIAYSRAHYARPRAEVEALIAQQWDITALPPEGPQERAVWEVQQTLRQMGVTRDQTSHLLSRYPLDHIQQQIAWLPYRSAKNPLGFLLAAIEGDYAMPLSLRQQQRFHPDPAAESTVRVTEAPNSAT